MNEKQRAFAELHPDVHPDTLRYFPDFDYRHVVGDRSVLCNYSNPNNIVGHQQRAWNVWWACEAGGPLMLGLDLGAPRKCFTPYALHVDLCQAYANPDLTDVKFDISRIDDIIQPSTLAFITSNHSLEHMPNVGDKGIVELVVRWTRLIVPGGILGLIVPDQDFIDVMACDPDHKHAWGGSDFKQRVLDEVIQRTDARLLEYNTLRNEFSVDAVLEIPT